MLTIRDRDVKDGVYVGAEPRAEDVVMVPAKFRRLVFPFGLNVKGLMTGTGVDIVCSEASRIRHAQLGGNAKFSKSLFCGAVEAAGTIFVLGDLVSWMGDIVSRDGNIVAAGEIRSAGAAIARNGAIVSKTGIFAETKVFSLNTWHPRVPEPLSGLAALAVRGADGIFTR